MRKNVLFFNFDLSPSGLVIVIKYVWAVRTNDSILIRLFVYSLKIKYLPIFQILKSISSYKRNPIIFRISCHKFIDEASIIGLEFITIHTYIINLNKDQVSLDFWIEYVWLFIFIFLIFGFRYYY
jgi:hypothetical protein